MRTRQLPVGLAFVALCSLAYPTTADARTCAPDLGAGYVYVGSQLPARARGVLWFTDVFEQRVEIESDQLELLELLVSGGARAVPYELEKIDPFLARVVPRGGFKPGVRYRMTTRAHSAFRARPRRSWLPSERIVEFTRSTNKIDLERASLEVTVTVSPKAELLRIDDLSGSGQADVLAHAARVSVTLSPQLEPFRESLLFSTEVDGDRWFASRADCALPPTGRSWQHPDGVPAGDDLLFASCRGPIRRYPFLGPEHEDEFKRIERYLPIAEEGRYGLESGVHSVVVVARGDDDTLALRSSPVQFELRCPADDPVPLEPARANPGEPVEPAKPPTIEPGARGCAITPDDMSIGTWCIFLLGLAARRRRAWRSVPRSGRRRA